LVDWEVAGAVEEFPGLAGAAGTDTGGQILLVAV